MSSISSSLICENNLEKVSSVLVVVSDVLVTSLPSTVFVPCSIEIAVFSDVTL